MNINSFPGDLTDVSAEKQTMVISTPTVRLLPCSLYFGLRSLGLMQAGMVLYSDSKLGVLRGFGYLLLVLCLHLLV